MVNNIYQENMQSLIFKESVYEFSLSLSWIFNKSLTLEVYPHKWQNIYKKDIAALTLIIDLYIICIRTRIFDKSYFRKWYVL